MAAGGNEKVRKVISVIGPAGSFCNPAMYDFAIELGHSLVSNDFIIVCGGMDGIMEAVCRGARHSPLYYFGCTIGIIPASDKSVANRYCDIIIPTGMGAARNQIVVCSGDAIVALGGGAGTLSELAFAWQFHKKVICYTGFEGWSRQLAGTDIDGRASDLLISAGSLEEIITVLKEIV